MCAFKNKVDSHYNQFNESTSYERGYAQCGSWRKNDTNQIRISINGRDYFTEVHEANNSGPHPYSSM